MSRMTPAERDEFAQCQAEYMSDAWSFQSARDRADQVDTYEHMYSEAEEAAIYDALALEEAAQADGGRAR